MSSGVGTQLVVVDVDDDIEVTCSSSAAPDHRGPQQPGTVGGASWNVRVLPCDRKADSVEPGLAHIEMIFDDRSRRRLVGNTSSALLKIDAAKHDANSTEPDLQLVAVRRALGGDRLRHADLAWPTKCRRSWIVAFAAVVGAAATASQIRRDPRR